VSPADLIAAGFRRGGCRARRCTGARLSPLAVVTVVLALLVFVAPAEATRAVRGGSATVEFSCTGVTFNYSGFPDLPGNTVREKVRLDGEQYSLTTFTFDGPSATDTVPVLMTPGHHGIDGWTSWTTNGVRGGRDKTRAHGIACPARPLFAIQKLQEVVGEGAAGGGFTSSPLSAAIGQSVRYQITVSNTGNVPLTFNSLSDPRCDSGTLTGGPGEAPVGVGQSAEYLCEHAVGLTDLGAPTYTNSVTTSATFAEEGEGEGEGTTVSAASNTVVVNLLAEPPSKEPPAKEPASGGNEGNTGQGGGGLTQTQGNAAQQAVQGSAAAALPNPVFNHSANLVRVAGVVLIKLPGSKKFLRLRAGTSVPIGTIIDATRGRAELTTAADTASHTQETGTFFGGVFRLGQTTITGGGAGNALTVLKLVGPLPSCLVEKFGKRAAHSAAKRRTRRLFGQAKGNFRTVGRYAAATVRGTKWLTEDMCAGTLIRVLEHAVKVDAFPHHRHFLLGQGQSFIAHP